jgi:hypothetical protein
MPILHGIKRFPKGTALSSNLTRDLQIKITPEQVWGEGTNEVVVVD